MRFLGGCMNTKIEGWQLIVPRKTHQYLTHYGFRYQPTFERYAFESKLMMSHHTFRINFYPLEKTINMHGSFSCEEGYDELKSLIVFYSRRKKYLREKGLIK